MKTAGDVNEHPTPCRLVERLAEESVILILILPDGRELELDRRKPGNSIDPEGIAALCSLIRIEVRAPILEEPAPGDLSLIGYEIWRRVGEQLRSSEHDPDSLMPIF